MADNNTEKQRVQELTDKLEQGWFAAFTMHMDYTALSNWHCTFSFITSKIYLKQEHL